MQTNKTTIARLPFAIDFRIIEHDKDDTEQSR
jgi:hypothetical protein